MINRLTIQFPDHRGSVDLAFEKNDDRWSHEWDVVSTETSAGHRYPVLRSVEGNPDQTWPPSPALQDISRHDLENGPAVLGVGMAGVSHFSASYSVESSRSQQPTQIKSDLACLQKQLDSNATLGSTYQVDPWCQPELVDATQVKIVTPVGKTIVLRSISDSDETIFQLDGNILRIVPEKISQSTKRSTRWGFVVTI